MNELLISVLTLFVIISAVVAIVAREKEWRRTLYFFKPLAMVFILTTAVLSARPVFTTYFYFIVTALCFCLAGDVFLMLPERFFLPGLGGFLTGHVWYVLAFTSEIGFGLTLGLLLPVIIVGFILFFIIAPSLGKMKIPVFVYTGVILLMVWQAWERYIRLQRTGALLAGIGALFFFISDSILAMNKFRSKFRHAHTFILSVYFTAQLLMALSAGQ